MASEPPKATRQDITGSPDYLREFYGLDTDRKWATTVQFLLEEDHGHVLLIFREGVPITVEAVDGVPEPEGEKKKSMLAKNVASVIMPIKVARRLGEILVANLPENPVEPENG